MCDKLPNGRYDIKEYFAVLPIISDRDEVKGHVFSENLLFLNDSKNLFHI